MNRSDHRALRGPCSLIPRATLAAEAVRLSPNNDHVHPNLGLALSRKNDQEGALEEYREAICLNPDNGGAHLTPNTSVTCSGRKGRLLLRAPC